MADHDHVFKLLFAHPRLAGELVREFLPRGLARELDPGSLEPFPAEQVGDRLEARMGDLVWRLRLRDGRPVYLLLEFQSRPDRAMALRMLVYAGLLAQGLVRRGGLRGQRRLPPILPVVLYNGQRPWRAAGEVAELFAAAPKALARGVLRHRPLLLEVGKLRLPAAQDNLVGLLFRLERSRSAPEIRVGLQALRWELDREPSPELRRAFGTWLLRAFRDRAGQRITFGEGETMFEQALAQLEEHYRAEALAEGLAKGKAEGKAEGRVEGRVEGLVEGQARLLLRMLALRFGPLEAVVYEKVAAASSDQLTAWGERLMVVAALDEVFAVP